mgnify:FL=1
MSFETQVAKDYNKDSAVKNVMVLCLKVYFLQITYSFVLGQNTRLDFKDNTDMKFANNFLCFFGQKLDQTLRGMPSSKSVALLICTLFLVLKRWVLLPPLRK